MDRSMAIGSKHAMLSRSGTCEALLQVTGSNRSRPGARFAPMLRSLAYKYLGSLARNFIPTSTLSVVTSCSLLCFEVSFFLISKSQAREHKQFLVSFHLLRSPFLHLVLFFVLQREEEKKNHQKGEKKEKKFQDLCS
jgi:hypothetical protein